MQAVLPESRFMQEGLQLPSKPAGIKDGMTRGVLATAVSAA